MRAVVCNEFGPPENLVVEERPEPTAGAGEIVVDVRAAAVTFPDALMIQDEYQFKPAPPFVPGGEAAGDVVAVGEGVSEFAVGDAVVSQLGLTGGFAERVVASAANTRPVPKGMDYAESTGLMYAYGTSQYALKYRGELQAGETLLVLGAAGNVGLTAVELGAQMGARVIAVASSPDKLELCKQRGAAEGIDYTREDLKSRVKELTEGRGADVVYDAVGGDHAEAALRATAWKGRFLVIGFTAGIPNIPLNLALLKGCQIVGVFFGAMISKEPELRDRINRELLEMAGSGKLSPHVSKHYPLAEAGQALRDLRERRAVGKLVVAPHL